MFNDNSADMTGSSVKERKMNLRTMLLSVSLFLAMGGNTVQALAAEADKNHQTISRAGSQASIKGSAEYFTGNVHVDPLFHATDAAPYSGAYVTFEPGARSAWHIDNANEILGKVLSSR